MEEGLFKIAIIGAGPAEGMLARLLDQESLPGLSVTIFEAQPRLDNNSSATRDGGTLDLHPKSGLRAIRAAQLWNQFSDHARFDGSFLDICDKHGTTYFRRPAAKPGAKDGNPEIDRAQPQQILRSSLPTSTIRSGHHLDRVVNSERTLRLTVSPDHVIHTEENFDLLVGADGASSTVRAHISAEKPTHTGIYGFNLRIPRRKIRPAIAELINRGSVFAFSDGKAIMGQQLGSGEIDGAVWSTSAIFARPAFTPDSSTETNESLKAAIIDEFRGWDAGLLALLEDADPDSIQARSIHALQQPHQWDFHEDITLICDAAHVMPPFAGEGVNLALEDAASLADAILQAFHAKASANTNANVSGSHDVLAKLIASNISVHEQRMFKRARRVYRLSEG